MSATTSEGTGLGMAVNQGSLPLNGPHIVACGEVVCDGWKVRVDLESTLPLGPDHYVVMLTQNDVSGDLGGADGLRGDHAPHAEKFMLVDNVAVNRITSVCADWASNGLAGFVLHAGADGVRTFGYTIVKTGFLRNNN